MRESFTRAAFKLDQALFGCTRTIIIFYNCLYQFPATAVLIITIVILMILVIIMLIMIIIIIIIKQFKK
jgi:hypothetical protein